MLKLHLIHFALFALLPLLIVMMLLRAHEMWGWALVILSCIVSLVVEVIRNFIADESKTK